MNSTETIEDRKLTTGTRRLLEMKKRNVRGRITFYLEKGDREARVSELECVEKEQQMMIIDNKFDLGKIVYLKTDKDQIRRIVTAIQSSLSGAVLLQNKLRRF